MRALKLLITAAARYTKNVIVPSAESAKGVDQALDGLKTVIAKITPNVAEIATRLISREEIRNRKDWVSEVKSSTGINLAGQLSRDGIEDDFAMIVRRNVALIEGLGDDVRTRIERLVTQAVIDGTRSSELEKALREDFGIVSRRAKLIARDQIQKANSDLTMLRQEQCGITHYRWSGAMDARERPTHKANEGKRFAWAKPPAETGHPGHDINCRCVAIALVELPED